MNTRTSPACQPLIREPRLGPAATMTSAWEGSNAADSAHREKRETPALALNPW